MDYFLLRKHALFRSRTLVHVNRFIVHFMLSIYKAKMTNRRNSCFRKLVRRGPMPVNGNVLISLIDSQILFAKIWVCQIFWQSIGWLLKLANISYLPCQIFDKYFCLIFSCQIFSKADFGRIAGHMHVFYPVAVPVTVAIIYLCLRYAPRGRRLA